MRAVSVLFLSTLLGSCMAVPPPPAPMRDASQQATFMRVVGDKIAGPPINCVPSYNQNDMSIVDGRLNVKGNGLSTSFGLSEVKKAPPRPVRTDA